MIIQRSAVMGCLGGVLLVCLTGCGAPVTRDVAVDRYDVALAVLADGSLDVRERITVRSDAPAGGWLARDVAAVDVDRIIDVEVTLDGRPVPASAGGARLDRAGDLHAAWAVAPAGDTPHTLALHYRLAGALRVQGPRGILRWHALPVDRPYAVGAARVDLTGPPGSVFAAGPDVEGGRASIVRRPAGATMGLASIAPREPVVVSAEIELASLNMAEPDWQSNAFRAHQLMPAFLSAGACLVVIGLGVLVMIRLQYPVATSSAGDLALATPESLAPAMAAVLLRARPAADSAARMATVLDLARRGLVRLSPEGILPADPSRSHVASGAEPARAHERAITDGLWLGRSGAGVMPLSDVAAQLGAVRRRFDRSLVDDLMTSGLLEAERLTVARGLGATGIVALGLAAAAALVCRIALARFGAWPMAVPVGLAVMGVLFLWSAARLPLWSEAGGRMRAAWRARGAERRAAARAGQCAPDEFERWLAAAVGGGFADDWIAAWGRLGQVPPPAPLTIARQYTSRL